MKKRYLIDVKYRDEDLQDGGLYKIKESAIRIAESGIFLGHTSNWQVNKNDLKTLNIHTKPQDIDLTNKKVYRYPHLTLPRQKVDLLKERFGMKIIRNPDKADYHVISSKFIGKLINLDWSNHFTFSDIFNFFKELKELDTLSPSGLEKARDFVNHGDRDGIYSFMSSYYYGSDKKADAVRKNIEKAKVNLSKSSFANTATRAFTINENEKIDTYTNLVNNADKIIYDLDLLDIIDEDLAVIDNSEYDRIKQMICSSDRENRTLAIEMLANCNINKSFDVVSGLYYWHYDWFKDTANWNSVNVKSLREQLKAYEGSKQISASYPYNQFLNLLASDGKLTKFAVDRTRNNLVKNVLKNYVNGDGNAFSVATDKVILNPKLTEQIIDE